MRSMADDLRDDTRKRIAAMSPEARVELALALGDDDAAALAAARGIGVNEARTIIARSRRLGRRPSCADAD
ncbi:MAG: hypothetical protein R2752_02330 [Vicinamibacterales bacterium]